MPDIRINILLDQNIPREVVPWLRSQRPSWIVNHVTDCGLEGASDARIYQWAQQNEAIVISYDEDFGDARTHRLGEHHGIVRLRVWPTTAERTLEAISRLLASVSESNLSGSLIIIDNQKIRIRRG